MSNDLGCVYITGIHFYLQTKEALFHASNKYFRNPLEGMNTIHYYTIYNNNLEEKTFMAFTDSANVLPLKIFL